MRIGILPSSQVVVYYEFYGIKEVRYASVKEISWASSVVFVYFEGKTFPAFIKDVVAVEIIHGL